jgi:hypothetical protein
VRFLARRVYLGAVVVLASALQHGVSAFRATQLKELFGASQQTLARWRTWWLEAFPASRFWQDLRGRFMPAIDEAALPRSLVERFEKRSHAQGRGSSLKSDTSRARLMTSSRLFTGPPFAPWASGAASPTTVPAFAVR